MMELFDELLPIGQAALWSSFIVFLRVGSMMALIPAFGEMSVPVRVKLGLSLAFTMIVAPAVSPDLGSAPERAISALGYLLTEMGIGVVFGVFLRLFVLALQIAGSIAAQSTSLSQIFGGSAGSDPAPAMGHILVSAGLALATLMGLHVRIAGLMIFSYELLPAGIPPSAELLSEIALSEIGRCFAMGFALAAPFVIASLLYNVMLGVINKAMPQLMVSFVGAPAITAGGLILMLVAAPLMLSIWIEGFNGFMADPFGGQR